MKMVELMAREMCKADGFDWDELTDPMKNASGGDNDQEGYLVHAVAALRAMREPTHDMLVALSLPPRIGRSVSYPDGWVSKEAFAAMIDVVLRESEAEQ